MPGEGRPRTIREDALNVPNLLTMIRVVMIPVVLYLLVDGTPEANFWAAVVYVIAAVTDALDGWLARRQGLISVLGKFLDPLADKLLVMAVLVFMVEMDRVPTWAVVVIIARELSITALRSIAMSEGVVIAAQSGGKLKTAIQMSAILLLILHHPYDINWLFAVSENVSLNKVGTILLYISIIFAVTSAGEYVALFIEAVDKKVERLNSGDADEEEGSSSD